MEKLLINIEKKINELQNDNCINIEVKLIAYLMDLYDFSLEDAKKLLKTLPSDLV